MVKTVLLLALLLTNLFVHRVSEKSFFSSQLISIDSESVLFSFSRQGSSPSELKEELTSSPFIADKGGCDHSVQVWLISLVSVFHIPSSFLKLAPDLPRGPPSFLKFA
jgi:hypothetical protein